MDFTKEFLVSITKKNGRIKKKSNVDDLRENPLKKSTDKE
jgi:hypothetical protein